jgi:hypothetical protein
MTSIGIIIPSTSKGLNCKDYKETHFYRIFLKSFYKTISKKYTYHIYVVVDDDDPIYSVKTNKDKLSSTVSLMKGTTLTFISGTGIEKGWVTKMWNVAFQKAYDDGCDYFYQCGDDIEFLDKDWDEDCIHLLVSKNNVGLTGPYDYGREITYCTKFLMTQTFVSRRHMDFFGFYFPPEIKNWYCDDWITYVYQANKLCFPLSKRIINKGGKPRYKPDGLNDNEKVLNVCRDLITKYKNYIIL